MTKIDIYLVNYHQLNFINNYSKYFKYLTDEELLKINRLENNSDKVTSLIGLLLIKSLTNSEIKKTSYGKPYLVDNEFYFNISHSNEITGIAISDNDVGFDVEFKENDFDYKSWTVKESFFKLIGKGLGMYNENYEISNCIKYDNRYYYFKTYELDNYVLSVSSGNKNKINVKYLNNYELIKLLSRIKPVN